MTFTQNIVYWIYLGAGFKGGEVPLFLLGHIREAPYPFCAITYCALGMGFVRFSGATIRPLAHHGNGTLWNRKWTIYRTCLFYSLFGIGTSIYHSQIVKGPKHLLYQKFKREIRQLLILKTTLIYKYFQLYIKKCNFAHYENTRHSSDTVVIGNTKKNCNHST
jgi:hypothetical protein